MILPFSQWVILSMNRIATSAFYQLTSGPRRATGLAVPPRLQYINEIGCTPNEWAIIAILLHNSILIIAVTRHAALPQNAEQFR